MSNQAKFEYKLLAQSPNSEDNREQKTVRNRDATFNSNVPHGGVISNFFTGADAFNVMLVNKGFRDMVKPHVGEVIKKDPDNKLRARLKNEFKTLCDLSRATPLVSDQRQRFRNSFDSLIDYSLLDDSQYNELHSLLTDSLSKIGAELKSKGGFKAVCAISTGAIGGISLGGCCTALGLIFTATDINERVVEGGSFGVCLLALFWAFNKQLKEIEMVGDLQACQELYTRALQALSPEKNDNDTKVVIKSPTP